MARNQSLPQTRNRGEMSSGSHPFMSLHREMNRLFDDVFRGFGIPMRAHSGEAASMLHPDVDVSENENEFKICADLPGVSEQDVDVTLNDDVLTIRAERKQEHTEDKESYHVVERSHGMFQRSLRLPSNIEPDQVDARFENGVLTVRIPKGQEAQGSRRIKIQGSAARGQIQQSQREQQGEARQLQGRAGQPEEGGTKHERTADGEQASGQQGNAGHDNQAQKGAGQGI